jgi:hypothetical protein
VAKALRIAASASPTYGEYTSPLDKDRKDAPLLAETAAFTTHVRQTGRGIRARAVEALFG